MGHHVIIAADGTFFGEPWSYRREVIMGCLIAVFLAAIVWAVAGPMVVLICLGIAWFVATMMED